MVKSARKNPCKGSSFEELHHWLNVFAKTYHPEPPKVVYYWEKTKKVQFPDLKFHKVWKRRKPACIILSKTYYVLQLETSSQIVCSWLRRPEAILEVREEVAILKVISKSIIYMCFQDFTNNKKKTNWLVVFCNRPLPNILKYRGHM